MLHVVNDVEPLKKSGSFNQLFGISLGKIEAINPQNPFAFSNLISLFSFSINYLFSIEEFLSFLLSSENIKF